MAGADLDVVIIGDGPAGLALARACAGAGLHFAVVGEGRPWSATYGAWRDDVNDLPDRCFAHVTPSVVVHTPERRVIARPYGVLDNMELRAHLSESVPFATDRAKSVQHFTWGSRVVTAGSSLDAKLVVGAAGSGGALVPLAKGFPDTGQSAFGVVLDNPPAGFDAEFVTLMDLRPTPASVQPPSFAYVVPVADGWLVEETVLASRPLVDPLALRQRLISRIGATGAALVASARRTETVTIPMGGRLPSRHDPVVRFGAAAGYVHPATGFSVTSSLRAAPRVAAAIADATGDGRTDARPVWNSVWPAPLRRTRRLHDYGLEVLLGLHQRELGAFFDAFFDLPIERWAGYLRIDTRPAAVSATMALLFARLPGRVRRCLLVRPGGH